MSANVYKFAPDLQTSLFFSSRDFFKFIGPSFFLLYDQSIPPEHLRTYINSAQESLAVEGNQDCKDLKSAQKIWDFFVKHKIKRNHQIVILGGGGVGDLCAFACSLYHRGVPFNIVPTTLLAMLDSCFGGKTAINYQGAKNILGTFSLPSSIFIDINFLATLPERIFLSGLGEINKYLSLEQFPFQLRSYVDRDPDMLAKTIQNCLEIKYELCKTDLYDQKGIREKLNLGHTVGHALEVLESQQVFFYHGEAVFWGLLAERFLESPENAAIELINNELESYYFQYLSFQQITISEISFSELWPIMQKDKKIGRLAGVESLEKKWIKFQEAVVQFARSPAKH